MKILYLIDNFPPQAQGGAGVVAYNLAQAMVKAGHEVYVLTTVQDQQDAGISMIEGMTVKAVCVHNEGLFRFWLGIYNPTAVRLAKQYAAIVMPDILHAHNINGFWSWASLATASKYARRTFVTMHDVLAFAYSRLMHIVNREGQLPKELDYRMTLRRSLKQARFKFVPFRNLLIRLMLWRANARVIAVSEALQTALAQNSIKADVIYNGVSDEIVTPSVIKIFREKYKIEGKRVVVFGGRLMGSKGTQQLLDAMVTVVRFVPDAVLLIVGSGGDVYDTALRETAKALDISEAIIQTGWLPSEQTRIALAAGDVVCVPSVCFDSLPTMLIDAAMLGRPAVATCYGGAPEIVGDGETGYIVNPYDTALMARRLSSVLTDSNLRTRLGIAARHHALNKFTLDSQVKKTLESYNAQ